MKNIISLYIDIHKGDEKNEKKMLTLRIVAFYISFRDVPGNTCYLDHFSLYFYRSFGLTTQK